MSAESQAQPNAHILLVEDDPAVRNGVKEYLLASGFEISEADTCAAAQVQFQTAPIDMAIVDYHLPDGNALQLITAFKGLARDVPVVVLTGHGSIDLAVRTIQAGAEQFLTKPVDLASLLVVIEKSLEHGRNRRHVTGDQVGQARQAADPFLGTSAAVRALQQQVMRVVKSHAPVLILGETGSGKGVLARWMHANGPRAREPYIDLNCAGLARELIESELFGHEKGAFTGATAAKAGLIEVAHRGTVFLDEIGDLDLAVQPKLLKVLEEKRFRRVGDVRERTVDVRFIAAANQDLAKRAEEKTFRQDLLYRINTVTLHVPALRERREDIPLLAQTILESLARDMPAGRRSLTAPAMAALQEYHWPGNLRELRNTLEHAVLLSDSNAISADALGLSRRGRPADPPSSGDLTLKAAEIQEITRALRAEGGRVERAAQRLGVPRSSLYQKIRKYGIAIPRA
jgi:DNA-binding NtrC family response regulator